MPAISVHPDQRYTAYWNSAAWVAGGGGSFGNGDSWSQWRLGVGFHFDLGATIPRYSTINSSSWSCIASGSYLIPTFYIKAELAGSPGTIADIADLVARRGLTAIGGVPGVSDAGLVTVALLDETVGWVSTVLYSYDIAALLQELANAFDITKLEIFVDDFNGRTSGDGVNNFDIYDLTKITFDVDYTEPPPPPTVTSATPDRGKQGQHLASVVIAGVDLTGATVVDFGAGVVVNSFSVDTDIQITADITIGPTATLGFRDVTVTTPGGPGVLTHGFLVTDSTGLGLFEVTAPAGSPIVSSISPPYGVQGTSLTGIVIGGSGFLTATDLYIGYDFILDSWVVDSDIQITAAITIPTTVPPGLRDVVVTNASGTGALIGGFECIMEEGVPIIVSVTPDHGNQGDHLASVVIAGYFFTGV
jgi:hypothetical protein